MVNLKNNSEINDLIYDIISNPVRREIIVFLYENKPASFTEIMEFTGQNTGSLSFHLKKMEYVLMRDDNQRYLLNEEGMRAFSMMNFNQKDEKNGYPIKNGDFLVNLKRDELLIISSNSVKPLGRNFKLGGLNKSSTHDISVALTSERLIFSGWRFFSSEEIPLSNVKLVTVRRGIPLLNGSIEGEFIEITYSNLNGNLQKIRFLPPNVSLWITELKKNIKD